MKGKGKGDRNSGQHRDSQSGTESMKDCPLQFPDLAPVEHTRLCPRYTAGRKSAKSTSHNCHDVNHDVSASLMVEVCTCVYIKYCSLLKNWLWISVLQRSSEDGIGLEEADTLQTELETLLASVAKRMRLLENEIDILASWQDKARDKKVAAVWIFLPFQTEMIS